MGDEADRRTAAIGFKILIKIVVGFNAAVIRVFGDIGREMWMQGFRLPVSVQPGFHKISDQQIVENFIPDGG